MVAVAVWPGLGIALSLGMEERLVETPESVEAALVRSAVRGDRRAFGRLVDFHKRAVFGLCVRLLRDGEEAKDAAQESFARAYAALESYDPALPFAPWVLRIARNHCLDVLRRRLPASRQLELDAPEAEDGSPPRELADTDAPRADEAIERREVEGALAVAVAALPPNYREVVHLFHVEHLSYKEIAATLEVPIGTVMTWLYRARAKLRAALSESDLEASR